MLEDASVIICSFWCIILGLCMYIFVLVTRMFALVFCRNFISVSSRHRSQDKTWTLSLQRLGLVVFCEIDRIIGFPRIRMDWKF